MSVYSGMSFVLPMLLDFVACAAWFIVVGRMTNLDLPWYKRALTFGWAMSMLALGVIDMMREHYYDERWQIVSYVALILVVRAGIIVLAYVRYQELGRMYPVRMSACEFEPSSIPPETLQATDIAHDILDVAAAKAQDLVNDTTNATSKELSLKALDAAMKLRASKTLEEERPR